MQLTDKPTQLPIPFANSGTRTAIPTASQIGITAGAASLTDGFPPLTRTPIAAGGVPPSGADMNGILYQLSAADRWANVGGGYPYNSTYATAIGGYPKGARLVRTDGIGYWLNTVDNNTTDPEAGGAGWRPDLMPGATPVTMTGSNVTLTALQYGQPVIRVTGLLTANLNLIFPAITGSWTVINATTGNYTITAKTASGTGVLVAPGRAQPLVGDGTNLLPVAKDGFLQEIEYSTAGQTIPATQANAHIHVFGACSSVTLPLAASVPAGSAITFGASSLTCTINRQGSDVLYLNASHNLETSLPLLNGGNVRFVSDGATQWFATGEATLKYAADFAASLTTNGQQIFPSGLILKWVVGAVDPADTTEVTQNLTYATAFPTASLAEWVSVRIASASTTSDQFYQTFGASASGCSVQRQVAASSSGNRATTPILFALGY